MRTAKKILLIGVAIGMMLSLTGCMVISCEDDRPHRPRRLGHPRHSQVIQPIHGTRF